MHHRVYLLTKAEDKDGAETNARAFMDEQPDSVCDWYVIGGRWSGYLNPLSLKFREIIDKEIPCDSPYGRSVGNINDNKEKFDEIWKRIGGTGRNPYNRDQYNESGESDDVVLAKDVELDLIKASNDFKKAKVEALDNLKNAIETGNSIGYYSRINADIQQDYFSDESYVYDIDEETNQLPTDLTEYYAIVIDMHN